jgi:hypothetical protein
MADLFSFPDIPKPKAPLGLYRTPVPKERAQDAKVLAERFGVSGEVRDAHARLIVSDARSTLEVFMASDSLRWGMIHTLTSEEDGADGLPDDDEAKTIASVFLKSRGISLADTEPHSVMSAITWRHSPDSKSKPERRKVSLQINYAYTLDGLRVFGPGAKAQVTVGGKGRVMECYQFWRRPQRDGEHDVLSGDAVVELLRRDPMFRQLKSGEATVTFRSARLGYYALTPREYQRALIPVYAFDGTVSTPLMPRYDFVRYVVATRFDADQVKRQGIISHAPAYLFS